MKETIEEIKKVYPYEYTVTDPCYLLDNDRWDECWKRADEASKAKGGEWDGDTFSAEIEKALREISGGYVFACGTGFGDWSNAIYVARDSHNTVKIKGSGFGADSGMVCVVEVTDALRKYLDEEYKDNSFGIGAFFYSKERGVSVMTEGSSQWEVLRIMVKGGATIKTEDEYVEDEY